MSLMLILASAWALLAAPVALLIGRSIRLADTMESRSQLAVPDFVPEHWAWSPTGSR